MSEFAFIDWIRKQTVTGPRVVVGPGDDTAVLERPGGQCLVTTDMLLEGSCSSARGGRGETCGAEGDGGEP